MLLVVPLGHLTQQQMWSGPAIEAVANLAVQIGLDHCPEGFPAPFPTSDAPAHQSQPHAHLHIVSGTARDLERAPRTGAGVAPELQPCRVSNVADATAPLAIHLSPEREQSQVGFWTSALLPTVARKAVNFAETRFARGFTVSSPTFSPPARRVTEGPAGLYVQGGGQLGLYV